MRVECVGVAAPSLSQCRRHVGGVIMRGSVAGWLAGWLAAAAVQAGRRLDSIAGVGAALRRCPAWRVSQAPSSGAARQCENAAGTHPTGGGRRRPSSPSNAGSWVVAGWGGGPGVCAGGMRALRRTPRLWGSRPLGSRQLYDYQWARASLNRCVCVCRGAGAGPHANCWARTACPGDPAHIVNQGARCRGQRVQPPLPVSCPCFKVRVEDNTAASFSLPPPT